MSAAPKAIVAIGEALWDLFPEERRPGGAPCNVAYHASQLGDLGVIVTRVGKDRLGDELLAFLTQRGVDTALVQRDSDKPTGTVSVTIEDSEPEFTIVEDVAWDYLQADSEVRGRLDSADAVCVGSLAQRSATSHAAIREMLMDTLARTLVVFDVNLRPPFIDADAIESSLQLADVVKMSASEIGELAELLDRPTLIPWLIEDVGVRSVCVTRERDGASMVTLDGVTSVGGLEVDTTTGDPVGAGDAFTAALTHQLIRDSSPERALDVANRYAALVVTKHGAMPSVSGEEVAAIGL